MRGFAFRTSGLQAARFLTVAIRSDGDLAYWLFSARMDLIGFPAMFLEENGGRANLIELAQIEFSAVRRVVRPMGYHTGRWLRSIANELSPRSARCRFLRGHA